MTRAEGVALRPAFAVHPRQFLSGWCLHLSSTRLSPSSASRGSGPELTLGSTVDVDVGPNAAKDPAWIDLPNRNPLTSLEVVMEPSVDGARDGFSWTGSDAWDHPGAVSDGVSTAGGALVGSGGAQFWDFNTGAGMDLLQQLRVEGDLASVRPQRTSGGAIRTYAARPTRPRRLDLSGVPSMPLHVMIRQGPRPAVKSRIPTRTFASSTAPLPTVGTTSIPCPGLLRQTTPGPSSVGTCRARRCTRTRNRFTKPPVPAPAAITGSSMTSALLRRWFRSGRPPHRLGRRRQQRRGRTLVGREHRSRTPRRL